MNCKKGRDNEEDNIQPEPNSIEAVSIFLVHLAECYPQIAKPLNYWAGVEVKHADDDQKKDKP